MTALEFLSTTGDNKPTHWSESGEDIAIKMEEYAQLKAEQEAIGFAEWIRKNYFYDVFANLWFKLDSDADFDLAINGHSNKKEYTTEELFKLYKDATTHLRH